MRLFQKKEQPAAAKGTPVRIVLQEHGAEVFAERPSVCFMAPEIIITLTPERMRQRAVLTVKSDAVTFCMEAPRLSGQTRVLFEEMDGVDAENRLRVHVSPENHEIEVPQQDTDIAQARFFYRCEPERISFFASGRSDTAIMELKPVFDYDFTGVMLKGWIAEDWEAYLPFLCGILQYHQLL